MNGCLNKKLVGYHGLKTQYMETATAATAAPATASVVAEPSQYWVDYHEFYVADGMVTISSAQVYPVIAIPLAS